MRTPTSFTMASSSCNAAISHRVVHRTIKHTMSAETYFDGFHLIRYRSRHARLAKGSHALEASEILNQHDARHDGDGYAAGPAILDELKEDVRVEKHLRDDE